MHSVYTIGLGGEVDGSHLSALGSDGSWTASDALGLEEAFAAAAGAVRAKADSLYILAYCSPSRAGSHELEVRWLGDESSLKVAFDADGFEAGCEPEDFVQGAVNGDDSGSVDGTLDELTASLDGDASDCDGVGGQDVPGAKRVFVGTYQDDGNGRWSGGERMVLFANEAWRDYGQDDCMVSWLAQASEAASPDSCPSCDIGLDVSFTLDLDTTDCPEGLYEDQTSYTESYGVRRGGGTATWFFAASGNEFATGTDTGSRIEFVMDGGCVYSRPV